MARRGNEGGIGKKNGEKLRAHWLRSETQVNTVVLFFTLDGICMEALYKHVKFYLIVFKTNKRREKIMKT